MLVVRPLPHPDTQLFAQTGTATVGQHGQVAVQFAVVTEAQAITIGQWLHVFDLGRHTPTDHITIQPGPQSLTEPGVFDYIAKRRNALFDRRQASGAEATPVRHLDLQDRLGASGNLLPEAKPFIDASRAERQCRRTRIVAGLPGFTRREGLDEHDFPAARLGTGLQRQRKARTDQSAADDGDIEAAHTTCSCAAAISASISATVLGTPPDRISHPCLVTTTSSSIRTPIPRHFFATSRLSGDM